MVHFSHSVQCLSSLAPNRYSTFIFSMAEYLRVDFQEMARMSLYDKLALNIEKIFRLIQTADDVQPIGNDPLDEIMKSILRNALPGIYNHLFRRW
jgi:hypothetical protein